MKILLTILFTLIAFVAFSQEGDPLNNAVKHNYETYRDWGTQWGVLKKPAGTGKHPTIIFFHGVGEAGSGSSDADKTRMEQLKPIAKKIAQESGKTIKLLKFKQRKEIETL